ncbi:hypothetical protein [Pseudonocardia lacus]|uniref:hypothetical protein n=1 Tax=Pseudonocardia lacus TaxID=2835865 RepID=UPI001BDDC97C|nr:hypothetical protein [Pseudonocardia lacus]
MVGSVVGTDVGGRCGDEGGTQQEPPDTEDVPTMMTHSFVTADLAAERTRTLRAEADAHRLARAAQRAATTDDDATPARRRPRLWGQAGPRPA